MNEVKYYFQYQVCTMYILHTRNPASRASERVRLVAIRPSSYVHRICNFKDCKEGFFLEFEMSVHRKSTTNNNKIVKKAYIFHVSPVMQ